MRLLWKYLKNYKWLLAGTLVLATINQVFSLLDPQIFRQLVDNYASRIDQLTPDQFFRGVVFLLLASVFVNLVSRIAKNFQDYYVNVINQKLGTKLYSDSVAHSFSLPYQVFEDQRSGEFLNKLQKARTDAQTFIASVINTVFLAVIGVLFVLVYAFYVNWIIGLVYFSIIPTLGSATFYISRRIKTAQQQINQEAAELAGSTTETIRNVELVKSLGLENQEIKRLNDVNERILKLELKKVKLVRTLSFIQGTLINALRSSLMLLMLWLIFKHDITLGQFFSLLFYSFAIFNPLGDLGNVAQQYQEASASLDRLNGILNTPAEEKPARPVKAGQIKEIIFDDVSFRYDSGTEDAVENITLSINAGDTIAFAGPSGSGKTTLVKLLVGLYRPTTGKVLLNGTPLTEADLESFRKKIGLVSQDTQLFAGTIRENLLFASPTATDEDCTKAIRSAAAMQLLERGGAGLDTVIGEGGLKLSGGEKQRLAIARALLRNPDLIIFDEATSSLDSITEEEITQTIRQIASERPGLITVQVAHRLSTIIHAHKIFVLEKGRTAESGSHEALLNNKGLYAALWRQQIASRETK
jgi:ATP-binding cassette, subfamily B, bacterial